jgi:hypothetical protein
MARPTDWAQHTYEGLDQRADKEADLLKSEVSVLWKLLKKYI